MEILQGYAMNEEVIKETIAQHTFYQPIEFGNGIVASNWAGKYTNASYEFGLKKWRYIIERNLPDVQGMRVLDIGCNSGLYCIQLARMGAREVVGIDSESTWPSWMEQAKFLKDALEWRCGTTYKVKYYDCPMTKIPDLNLGKFDLVIALCCIYYISDEEIQALLSYFYDSGCPRLVLQGNTNRRDQSREVYQRAIPKNLSSALKKAGYPWISVDAPIFYSRPVVVGSREPFHYSVQSKRDKIRDWIRKNI